MPADSLTKNSSEASLYLHDVMACAYFSWVPDAEAAARKEQLEARKNAPKSQMPVKKVRELKQLNVTPERFTATVARRGTQAEQAPNTTVLEWLEAKVIQVYDLHFGPCHFEDVGAVLAFSCCCLACFVR